RPYTRADLELAEEVASRAAQAVDNARLYREAQEALGARDEALARLKAVVEGATESFVLLDREGRLVYASPATEELTGLLPDAHLGQSFFNVPIFDSDRKDSFWNAFQNEITLSPKQSQVQRIVELT